MTAITDQHKNLSNHWQIGTTVDSTKSLSIRYALYKKTTNPITRCIVYLNGRTEWIEKYSHLANDLRLPEDCGFLALDHRGQGGSGGARSWVASYDDYVNDTRLVIDLVIPGLPYAIVAHSMGGLIAIYGNLK